MKYILSILFCVCLLSCHQNDGTTSDGTTSLEEKKPAITDTSIDKNMLASPEEMMDDSVFTDGSKPAAWSLTGINDPNQLKIFIKFLRFWVEKGNRDSLAAHIQYPLQNNKNIASPSDFLKKYDVLFNAKVIKAINDQKLSQIFRNSHGAMIGNGELWIRNVSSNKTDDFRITSINN